MKMNFVWKGFLVEPYRSVQQVLYLLNFAFYKELRNIHNERKNYDLHKLIFVKKIIANLQFL